MILNYIGNTIVCRHTGERNGCSMDCLKVTKISKPLAREFQAELIRENSRRFLYILLLVIISQLVFIPLELLRVLPWQNSIFFSRLGVIAAGLLFIFLLRTLRKNSDKEKSLLSLGYLLSAIQFICMIVGCYFVVNEFHNEIRSFSAYLLVAFVVSLTCVRTPYDSLANIAVFAGLSFYLHLFVQPVAYWVSEFLITLVCVMLLFIGNILNHNRSIRMFLKEKEILSMNRQLTEMSQMDTLTGICNRRRLTEAIDEHIQLFKRYGHTFCLAILDLDLFKEINDTFGHNAGDIVLYHFSTQIQSMLRSTDVFGRWGGEEFLLILPDSSEAEAQTLLERLRSTIQNAELMPEIHITFSAGICAYREHNSYSELVSEADQALYTAKNSGRNQTIVFVK